MAAAAMKIAYMRRMTMMTAKDDGKGKGPEVAMLLQTSLRHRLALLIACCMYWV